MQTAIRANRRIGDLSNQELEALRFHAKPVRHWSVNWDGVAAVGMVALSMALLVLAAFGAYSLIFD